MLCRPRSCWGRRSSDSQARILLGVRPSGWAPAKWATWTAASARSLPSSQAPIPPSRSNDSRGVAVARPLPSTAPAVQRSCSSPCRAQEPTRARMAPPTSGERRATSRTVAANSRRRACLAWAMGWTSSCTVCDRSRRHSCPAATAARTQTWGRSSSHSPASHRSTGPRALCRCCQRWPRTAGARASPAKRTVRTGTSSVPTSSVPSSATARAETSRASTPSLNSGRPGVASGSTVTASSQASTSAASATALSEAPSRTATAIR